MRELDLRKKLPRFPSTWPCSRMGLPQERIRQGRFFLKPSPFLGALLPHLFTLTLCMKIHKAVCFLWHFPALSRPRSGFISLNGIRAPSETGLSSPAHFLCTGATPSRSSHTSKKIWRCELSGISRFLC
jgi:hypothetical protein